MGTKKAARKIEAVDVFRQIDESFKEFASMKEAIARFKDLAAESLLTTYEQGGILNFAKDRFQKQKAGFQNFLLNDLRIDLARASRLMRIHQGIQRSGKSAESFEGISESSLLLLSPIMNSEKASERGALPKLMALAKKSPVKAVQEAAYKVRKIHSSGSGTSLFKDLHTIGRKFTAEGSIFAYVVIDSQGEVRSNVCCNPDDAEFLDVWENVESEVKSAKFVRTIASKSKGAAEMSAPASASVKARKPAKARKAAKSRKPAKRSASLVEYADDMDQNELNFDPAKKDAA